MAKTVEINIVDVNEIKLDCKGESINLTTSYTRINNDLFISNFTTNTPGEFVCPYCGNFKSSEEEANNCCEEPTTLSEEEVCAELENNLSEDDINVYINGELIKKSFED